MQLKDNIGIKGEILARTYLQDNGFTIRHYNWRFGHKEIDIVADKNNILHIIEVKTRTSSYLAQPKEAVVRSKQKNIIAAAEAYIIQYNINFDTQFDIISIIFNNNNSKIEYIPNAFSPYEK